MKVNLPSEKLLKIATYYFTKFEEIDCLAKHVATPKPKIEWRNLDQVSAWPLPAGSRGPQARKSPDGRTESYGRSSPSRRRSYGRLEALGLAAASASRKPSTESVLTELYPETLFNILQ